MHSDPAFPLTLYGASISYFTGKLENYFRIKSIPFQRKPLFSRESTELIREKTGSTQNPALELADDRWMSDSTAIIQWFETEYPNPPVMPENPLQRFFSLLLEDYADEWLWRPAMHFRWHYTLGARFASTLLAEEVSGGMAGYLPAFVRRRIIISRQRNGYTRGDGITPDQVPGVEAIYHRTLQQLEAIFQTRPFLLGDKPSLADVGFSGPMFRHFGLDPVAAEIMRQEAPGVYEWIARLWNTRLEDCSASLVEGIPSDWGPILDEIGKAYLPYLCANNDAVMAGQKHFDAEIDGVYYRGARWSHYRVWCLQRLRDHFNALPESDQALAQTLLEQHGCWEPLWRHKELPMEDGLCSKLPFHVDAKMIDVYK
jgi:glutathione S-transferase